MGMWPSYEENVSPRHDLYGTSLLDRHEWRWSIYVIEALCETNWQDEITPKLKARAETDMSDANTVKELGCIVAYQQDTTEMSDRLGEIFAEAHDYTGLFENACFFDAHTHPNTSSLVQIAIRIAWMIAQYYKEMFGRPRPSLLSREIETIVRIPTFPSYPSGHSTQVHLIKHALHTVMDGVFQQTPKHAGDVKDMEVRITNIAERVSVNREYAGAHFASDTRAGEQLAKLMWDILIQNENFQALIQEAIEEWSRPVQSGRTFMKAK